MPVNALVLASILAALVAGAAMLAVVHGTISAETVRRSLPAVVATLAAVAVTTGAGVAADAAPTGFLIALAAFALPVLIGVDATVSASGARGLARWLVPLAWGAVVFPLATIVPLALTRGCTALDCRIDDFGGALPLVVSSAAFALLAPTARGSGRRPDRPLFPAVLVLWLAFAVWIASLEGALDAYIPRILVHALVVPAAAALGWVVVDRLRGVDRPVGRSLIFGLLAGIVAAMPGTVTVGMPWALITGALAGALGGLAFGSRLRPPGPRRWALSLLVAALVGLLAPAISGDAAGAIFTARFVGVTTPVLAFAATAIAAAIISVPIWLVVRRQRVGRDDQGG